MVSRRELMIGLLGLVTSGAGVGVQVEATKNYSYDGAGNRLTRT